ncbi:MAG: SDR family oxidoreductase [Pseudomonadota bacterium]|nr:SDR family oxidoreductase [Pseudomonadota bacterium]
MAQPLEGKAAIVTGAGRGVGRAIAQRFAQAGARLLISDKDEAALRIVADRLKEDGAEVAAFACDLATPLGVSNLIAASLDAYDRVDVLANGLRQISSGDVMSMEPAALTEIFDVNVRTAFQLSQAAARRMIAQREAAGGTGPGGAIVNLSSIVGRRTVPSMLRYSVTCAAMDQLTRAMAVALAPQAIRVNAIGLGSVMTAALRDAFKETPDLREDLIRVTPMGRIGDAAEAAEAALYLCSPGASFVTGQILDVDGGRNILDPLDLPAL